MKEDGKALAIFRKVLGEEHPDTAISHSNRASNLVLCCALCRFCS
jgi:hypothetical protein